MFDQFKQLSSILKQAGELKEKAAHLKEELEHTTLQAHSPDNTVNLTLNGKGRVLATTIDPAALAAAAHDPASAQQLTQSITDACNHGNEQVQALLTEKVKEATGGMDIPGLSGMLN